MKEKGAILFLFFLLILNSCEEPYEVNDLDCEKKLLVVNGEINNSGNPFTIILSYATPFEGYQFNKVSGAKVVLYDNNGNSEILKEIGLGVFRTNGFESKINIGSSYRLQVQLGKTFYESIKTKLEEITYYDTIYAEPGEYKWVEKGVYGEIIKKSYKGINIFGDITFNNVENAYIKINNTVIWQTTRMFSPPGAIPSLVYYRSIMNVDNLPNVKSAIKYADKLVIKKHKICFIPYIEDESQGIDSLFLGPYQNNGWIIISKLQRISKEAYEYYKSANEQLGASEQYFDPVPYQLKGNIICKSDTNQQVFGLFNVYSYSLKMKAYYYNPSSTKVIEREVTDPGPTINEESRTGPFPYWIHF